MVSVPAITKTLCENISGARVRQALIDNGFELDADSFVNLVPSDDTVAFQDANGRTLTFAHIHAAISNARSILRGRRVAIVLPNSLELVVALVATIAAGATAIPVCYVNPPEEISRDITDLRADTLLVLERDIELSWVVDSGLRVVTTSDACMFFSLDGVNATNTEAKATDAALLIQTSGSTGKKKIVPYSMENLTIGVVCIAASMELSEHDVCCCMMPLFHAGGIFRSVLCPLLMGSKVVIHNSFSATEFWTSVTTMGYTWYYGSPTMHSAIIEHAPNKTPCLNIRLIANAAGGLLPVLAKRLAKTFPNATVMPSYGMTECMPIAAPPVAYKLEREKSSGRIIGPEVCIMDLSGDAPIRTASGAICIRGPPTFSGYEGTDPTDTFLPGGWFDTGDQGFLDDDGYLFITGRAKEVIKRGGETISPYEVEEQLSKHPKIRHAVAFSVPHATLQEVVGLVVVPKNMQDPPSHDDLKKHASLKLHPSKWPSVVVYAYEPPKGSTGKIVRVGLAAKWGIPTLTDIGTTTTTFELRDGMAVPVIVEAKKVKRQSLEWKVLAPTERMVTAVFRATLRTEIGADDDFFLEGGDSIKAAHAAAALSQKLGKNISPINIFQYRTARRVAELVPDKQESKEIENTVDKRVDDEKESTTPLALLIQLFPLMVFRPCTRFAIFTIGYFVWSTMGRSVLALGPAFFAASVFKRTVLPLVAIAFKWIVLGRLRPGRYPLWGGMYLRWWLSQQLTSMCGLGVFGWSFGLHRTYMRMMGARVGYNTRVSVDAHVGDYDLIDIGDESAIDPRAYVWSSVCSESAFVAEPISIGSRVLVGRGACVAPGASIPDGAQVLPNTSTHNGLVSNHTKQSELRAPSTNFRLRLLIGYPCLLMLYVLQLAPLAWGLADKAATLTLSLFITLVAIYTITSPIVRIVYTILIKRTLLGKFKSGPSNDFENFKYWLMSRLLPQPDLAGMQSLVGTHWAPITWIMRALGVQVGERVFWPGSGVVIDAYDLLTIHDDVVWGSRSVVRCRDATGVAQPVVLKAGSNVADRCIVYRGTRLGKNACLGTGSVTMANANYDDGTLWIGNDPTSNGGAMCLVGPDTKQAQASAEQPTIKPYGRDKVYWLPPWWVWAMLETCVTLAAVAMRMLPVCVGVSMGGLGFFMTQWAVDLCGLVIGLVSKWVIIGRRRVGQYSWDKSDYCMRWNLDLVVQRLRGKLLDLLGGSAYIVWYYRALGATIGRDTCLFPIGSDPMLTEPDLVNIGDRVCLNHAYVINHVNTRGDFQLNTITIGSHCTLCAHSRAMAGSVMDQGSMLLERSLLMPGEKLAKQKKKVGWP